MQQLERNKTTMKKHIIYSIISLLIGFSIQAQDDSAEEVLNENGFSKAELKEEQIALEFQDAFIDALQEKAIENYDKALESLAICENIFPNNVAMLFETAKNHFALKHYTAAHNYCEKALEIEPTNFWIIELTASIYMKEHNYPEAIRVQKKLYSMKKSEAGDLLRLYYYTRKKEEALALITEVENNSTYVVALDFYKKHFGLTPNHTITTTSKEVADQEDEAISLRKAFKKNATYSKLQVLLEKEYQQHDYQALLVDSGEGLERFPAQALVYLYNGIALNELNKHKDAIIPLEEGLDYVFDKPALTKRFYTALITAYTAINNHKKVTYYKELMGE